MRRIESRIDTASEEFRLNRAHNRGLADTLRERHRAARRERPARDLERLSRQNKMFVRDRIELLLDPGTPFLELSTLAANTEYGGEVPGAGIVSGIGIVNGREIIIHADDASVKGGAWYPLSVKKIVRTLDIAIENRLPVVHLCDSAGGFLPLQAEIFADRYLAGRIFRNQSILSKMGVPQVAIVLGHCTAGGAYVPALSEYNVIVRGTGAIFLGGPPLVKAATGEDVTVEELGGADVHTRISGTADYPANSEEQAIAIARELVAQTPRPTKLDVEQIAPEPPYYDPDELYGVIPRDIKVQFDVREVIARLVDGSRFHEYQPAYGTHADLRVCPHLGLQGRYPWQQRRLVQRQLAQGRALHAVVQSEPRADALPAEYHRLHGRPRLRASRHHQRRRQDDHGGLGIGSAEDHRDLSRLVRRRQLRHGGTGV